MSETLRQEIKIDNVNPEQSEAVRTPEQVEQLKKNNEKLVVLMARVDEVRKEVVNGQ